MVSHCPSTSKAITDRSTANGCDSTYRYHCMRTKQGSLTEQCLEISWIQDGKCAVYNDYAKRVDAESCNENLGICPQKQYLSNDVTSYSACVNEPEVHVSSLGPISHVFNVTTSSKSPSDGGRLDSTHLPLILVALIAVIAIIVIIVIYRYRRSSRNRSTQAINIYHKEKRESDHEEAIPMNTGTAISGQHESTIEETRHDTDLYYKTKTFEHIERLVGNSNVSILIVGESGSGKSVLVEMLYDKFRRKKVNGKHHDIKCMKSIKDLTTHKCQKDTRITFIIDDCFEDWNQYPSLVTQGLEQLEKVNKEVVYGKGHCVVITMSKWNFDTNLDAAQKAQLQTSDNLKIVDLSEKEFQLDVTDKTGILEYHRKKKGLGVKRMNDSEIRNLTDSSIIQSIVSYLSFNAKLEFGFPLTCRLLYLHDEFESKQDGFFSGTKKIIRNHVGKLSKGSKEQKCQYCTLIYIALHGGQIQVRKKNKCLLKRIAEAAHIDITDDLDFNFGCCLITKEKENSFRIIHEAITTLFFTSFGIGRTGLIIDTCSAEVLLKFMRTDDEKRRTNYRKFGYLIITNNLYNPLAEKLKRLDADMTKHVLFEDQRFKQKFEALTSSTMSGKGHMKKAMGGAEKTNSP